MGIVICETWEVLVLRVSKQLSVMSRDLGSIGPDLGSFGTMICMIWEVLVLRVGKYYESGCHVTWEVLGPVWTVGSFAIVVTEINHIMIFRHTLVCFAI